MKNPLFFIFLVALLSFSCSDDEDQDTDTIAPEIHEVEIDGEHEEIVIESNTTIFLEVEVEDNEALNELKLEVHDNFDGHEHGKRSSTWEEVFIWEVSGTEMIFEKDIAVPYATAGDYHMVFRALDEAGNESEFVELNVVLTNGEEPEIDLSNPDFEDGFEIAIGDSINLVGIITDDMDIEEITIHIAEAEEHDHDHDHESVDSEIFEMDIDLDGAADMTYSIDLDIPVPFGTESGEYEIEIRALDSDGNYGIFREHFEVL